MMKKRVFAMGAAVMLALSGCAMPFGAKEPTAQELVEGIEDFNQSKYNEMEVTMDLSATNEGQAVSLGLSGKIESAGDIVHMHDMQMDIGMSGFNMAVQMEGWADYGTKMSYSKMTAIGMDSGWTKEPMDGEDSTMDMSGLSDLAESLSDGGDSAVLQEHKKGEDYVVEWVADADSLDGTLSGMLDSYDLSGGSISMDSASVIAVFDAETHTVKSMSVKAAASEGEDAGELELSIAFLTINGDKSLSIPAEVLEAAEEEQLEDDLFGGGSTGDEGTDYGMDDGYTYSGDEEPWYIGTIPVINDMEGEDEFIDNLAKTMADSDNGEGHIYISHYEGLATVQHSVYFVNEDDIYASADVSISHMSDACDWTSLDEEFDDQYGWLQGSWYEGSEPIMGSKEDRYAVFTKYDSDGSGELDFVGILNDLYIEVSVYADGNPDDEIMLAYLQSIPELGMQFVAE